MHLDPMSRQPHIEVGLVKRNVSYMVNIYTRDNSSELLHTCVNVKWEFINKVLFYLLLLKLLLWDLGISSHRFIFPDYSHPLDLLLLSAAAADALSSWCKRYTNHVSKSNTTTWVQSSIQKLCKTVREVLKGKVGWPFCKYIDRDIYLYIELQ